MKYFILILAFSLNSILFAKISKQEFLELSKLASGLQGPEVLSKELELASLPRFFHNCAMKYSELEENLSRAQWEAFQAGLSQIKKSLNFIQLHNTNYNALEFHRDLNKVLRAVNSIKEVPRAKGLRERMLQAARKAPSSAAKKNGKMHLYGVQTWTSATGKTVKWKGVKKFFPGWNSCARVASAIARKGGFKMGVTNLVRSMESTLQRRGFRKTTEKNMEKGDVVIWIKDGHLNHIGYYTGWGINMEGPGSTTVDNWSISGEPEWRPLYRENLWGWKIRKILHTNR